MKKYLLLITIVTSVLLCNAQNAPWKEFDNFHHLVSKALHPVMTGNVQPVKDSSSALLASAKTWQASAIPAGVDATAFKTSSRELVKQCTILNDDVHSKQPVNVLKAQAVKVHDTFHALLAACKLKD
ncbi:MAG TPA: hypothetical protein VHB48_06840 [Chitinophagaceae bacterium]|nr:hypothetical protein [Chitinophagaceae bacterium]